MKYLQIIIRVFIILVAFLLNAVNVFGEVSSAFKPGNEDRILILNAYSGSSRWSNDFIIPIYNSYQHKNSPYVVDVEHMGSQFMHLQNAEELLEYEESLFGKYADNPPKLLILLGSASWGLLRDDIEKQSLLNPNGIGHLYTGHPTEISTHPFQASNPASAKLFL